MKDDKASTDESQQSTVSAPSTGYGSWISVVDKLPPLYRPDVLVIDRYGIIGIGVYMGHNTFTHNRYPVLGQASITHWMPLPEKP